MRIERITPFLVDRSLLVRVSTDAGIVGTGEAGLWAQQRLTAAAVDDLADYFVGKDATRIEHHYQAVTRNTHFNGAAMSAALSAIDIALWDIFGKAVGRSVADLLGGRCRDRVRVFANVTGSSPEARAEHARELVAEGYTSLRTQPFLEGWEAHTPTRYISTAIEITRQIREAVGFEIDLGLELHRNLGPDEAVTLGQALHEFRLQYYEDPVAPESIEALRYVARHVDMPIAAGERSYTLFQFKELLDTGTVGMIRPDISLAGGFTQGRKIAALAETAFVNVFPHLMGSPVNQAAFVQFAAAVPNYALMENGMSPLGEIVDAPLTVENGMVTVPDRPGIGVELREERLTNYPPRVFPIAPPRRGDGAVAH